MSDEKPQNWYEVKETSGTGLGFKIMLVLLKCTPSIIMRILVYPVGFFYWIFCAKARKVSKQFLLTESEFSKSKKHRNTLSHIVSFALNLVENLQSWGGKYSFKDVKWQDDDVQDLVNNINSGKGTLLLVNHVGNAQMLKGLAADNEAGVNHKMSITTVADVKINAGFTNLIRSVNSEADFHMISSDSIGPDTILLLQDRLEKGEVVVVAGDRISAHTDRTVTTQFMGKDARFPYGVYLMIALLNVPTYFVTGLRHKDVTLSPLYDMHVRKCPVEFDCGRKEREERILQTVNAFARELERVTCLHPYQWYNFYDFWG